MAGPPPPPGGGPNTPVAPPVKYRQVHYSKIGKLQPGSIWAQIESRKVGIKLPDTVVLRDVFEVKKEARKTDEGAKEKEKKGPTSLLDGKTGMGVNIFIKKQKKLADSDIGVAKAILTAFDV